MKRVSANNNRGLTQEVDAVVLVDRAGPVARVGTVDRVGRAGVRTANTNKILRSRWQLLDGLPLRSSSSMGHG